MNLRAQKSILILGAFLLSGFLAPEFAAAKFTAKFSAAACEPLFRLFGNAPAPTPAEDGAEATWKAAFNRLGGKPGRNATVTIPETTAAREARLAAAEAALPWNDEARILQGEQLLEMRAQITRQGKFRDSSLHDWSEVLERRNAARRILDPDPDGPDFLREAKGFAKLSQDERLKWVHYFGRSEHENAAATLALLYAKEPTPKVRDTLLTLALDRGFEFDSAVRAKDLAATLSRSPRLNEHLAANLRSLDSVYLERLLLHRDPNVRKHARAGLKGRPAAFLEAMTESLGDPASRAAAQAELRLRRPPPRSAELRNPDPLLRAEAAARLRPAENPEHLAAFRLALRDPVAEVKLAALATLKKGPPAQIPDLRRTLRALGQNDDSIRVRRLAHDLLEPYSRRAYAIAPSRTWMLDAMRRKFPTHIKLAPERARDMALMLAASHVYEVPELEGIKTARQLVAQHRRFLGSIPADYEVAFVTTDPATGFKAAIYRPTAAARAGEPAVVAIAGTQTGKDMLADLNWGVSQAKSAGYARLLRRVQEELKDPARPVAITGHSLGGGLAQMLAYDLGRALRAEGRANDLTRLRAVSWNGFGAQEALRKLRRWQPAAAANLDITSYFHPDDIVSKLGTHLGQTIAINKQAKANRGLAKLRENHVLEAVQDLFQVEHALAAATPAQPTKNSAALRALERFAGVTGGLTDQILTRTPARRAEELRLLAEARHEWAKAEGFADLNPRYDWLKDELDEATARYRGEVRETLATMEAANAELMRARRERAE